MELDGLFMKIMQEEVRMSDVFRYVSNHAEIGVGLALLDEQEDYVFFLAGTRHKFTSNELFYAGIGGHLEPGEDLLSCGKREAMEEIGAEVHIQCSPVNPVYISKDKEIRTITMTDECKPLAISEMIHPSGSPREGEIYYLVIYQATLRSSLTHLKTDEVSGVIAMKKEQVKKGVFRRATLQTLVDEGARLIASSPHIQPDVIVYPIGTAEALSYYLNYMESNQR
ncbi:8-oxo-dGTP pyrophosphatase MutT (NUDIX family) [Brevibacillus aydinogluensis]|uniref:NUDIX hydrolase n=1 Tax=Brevibacillus aydinogluensis TaxID=927786 RepID=UPI002892C958|nr:NUDIX hydrolase [Brevibacillus aydinogluensis]MDT3414471.1 8-oxo-dGTP pyrophosphatase MutT (NUDIX family) [Brevibacillus aydinogluensis]